MVHSTKHHLTILKDVDTVLMPGRFTLLLGPPGSGKTTLLKTLAGQYAKLSSDDLQVKGKVLYNGETFDTFHPARTCAYISQVRSRCRCLLTPDDDVEMFEIF